MVISQMNHRAEKLIGECTGNSWQDQIGSCPKKGQFNTLSFLALDVEQGQIQAIWVIANPEKLTRV